MVWNPFIVNIPNIVYDMFVLNVTHGNTLQEIIQKIWVTGLQAKHVEFVASLKRPSFL